MIFFALFQNTFDGMYINVLLLNYFLFDHLDANVIHLESGICTIFSMERFENLSPRHGTEKDVKNLTEVFEGLGFDVHVYKDLNSKEMQDTLHRYTKREYDSYQALLCFILSHGENEGIYTSDEKLIQLETIREVLLNTKGLHGKPKIVFIQACRGSSTASLVQVQHDAPNKANIELECRQKVFPSEVAQADAGVDVVPRDGEFMMVMATTPGKCESFKRPFYICQKFT